MRTENYTRTLALSNLDIGDIGQITCHLVVVQTEASRNLENSHLVLGSQVPPNLVNGVVNIDLLLEDEVCVPPVGYGRDHMSWPVAALEFFPFLVITHLFL